MSGIQFGCQFYTWQMSGERYIGQLPHILKVINAAGFAGIEPETLMLGAYYNDPQALKNILVQHGLELGALTLVLDWAEPKETEQEKAEAERIIDYLRPFPGTHLVLCQMPGTDRANLRERQRNLMSCVNAVARRAAERGISSSFHPNSPPGSIIRVQDDYRVLLEGLDSRVVGFAPDTGHIARGGMDVLEIFKTYRPLIRHVHFKDWSASGEWAAMGAGMIDFPAIVTMLRDTGFSGWIMIEEESLESETNPDGATNKNGKYLYQVLLPILKDFHLQKALKKNTRPASELYVKVHSPAPGQVRISGSLSARFQGNLGYLAGLYAERGAWMLEPFQKRGEEGTIQPRRDQPGELPWAGEYAGKWLDAASLAAAGNPMGELAQSCRQFASDLIAAQEADGYLGIELPSKRGENSAWDLWNIKYAMTGLLTFYEVSGDAHALQAAVRCGDWLLNQYGPSVDAGSPFYHSAENGGVSLNILDEVVRLFRLTGEKKLLAFARSAVTHFPLVERMRETNQAPMGHAYNLLGCLGAVVELFAAENELGELAWVEKVWEDLVDHHLYPTGSLGYNELLRLSAPNDTPVENGQPRRHHQETCATVEWLLFNSRLYHATGNVRYVEAMERAIYNALQSAQSIDGMQWMYFTPLRYEKRWFSGETSCCYWSGPRGISRLPGWVFALDDEGIRLNLYESGEATFDLDGRKVMIQTASEYPQVGKVSLTVQPEHACQFTLNLRIPSAGEGASISLNGSSLLDMETADGYFRIQRTWHSGDRVEMEFRIPTVVEHFLSDQYGVLVRGSEVLAVDQQDNPALDLDRLFFRENVELGSVPSGDGRRLYGGEMTADGAIVAVIFTTYADCGNQGSRFRTAFPILSTTEAE